MWVPGFELKSSGLVADVCLSYLVGPYIGVLRQGLLSASGAHLAELPSQRAQGWPCLPSAESFSCLYTEMVLW